MKAIKFYRHGFILLLSILVSISCEDEFAKYPTIAYLPCENTNVIKDSNILSDFECQANVVFQSVETVRNPAEMPFNKSKFVGKLIDGSGAWENVVIDYGTKMDLSTHSVFKLKIRTEVSGPLQVRLEGGTSDPVKKEVSVIGDKGWHEYIFDFSNRVNENHTKLGLYFNAGVVNGGSDVYYIDDLFFDVYIAPCKDVVKNLSIISDFECQQNYFLGIPANGTSATVVNNPNPNNVNLSEFAGNYIDDGTNPTDNLVIDFGSAIDLSVNARLNIKVYSTKVVPILAKLEGGSQKQVMGTIDAIGEWKNYTFDFSSALGAGNTKVVLYFNSGKSDGTNSDVYYIDDIQFLPAPCTDAIVENCSGVTPNLSIINDFNCQKNRATSATVVANPAVSCGNRSDLVGKYIDNGTEPYDALIINYGSVIDLSTKNKLKFKIYSPTAIQVLAKLEGGAVQEVWSDFSKTNTWEEFTYDFSASVGKGNTKVVLFFNGGKSNGTTSDVYYIDNLRFEAP
jgi:hypothetical protein